ncbi:MAG: hypothetical protein R3F59_06685 [Myxococcota bacterium]
MTIPMPSEVTTIDPLAEALDATDHPTRLAWTRSLNRGQQYALYALAEGRKVSVDDLVRGPDEVVPHYGRNGLLMFSLFQKRFARHGDTVVGYNHAEVSGLVRPLYHAITGDGHYVAYDSPDVPGEVWVDYRKVSPTVPPSFPPVADNEHGLAALIFGDMVDVIRRVSTHVFIGDSFKARYPRPDRPPLLARIGGMLPTAPFVLCQEPASTP